MRPPGVLLGVHPAIFRQGGWCGCMKRVETDLTDETFAGLDRESAELATELRAAAAAKCMRSVSISFRRTQRCHPARCHRS